MIWIKSKRWNLISIGHFNEQCYEFNECDLLSPFVIAGKAVFGVEYTGNAQQFCPQLNALDFDWLKKGLDLGAPRLACR
jgi:hypothetical protein